MVRGSPDTALCSSGRWRTALSASDFETSFDIVNKKGETEREREAKFHLQNYYFCFARHIDSILHRKLLGKKRVSAEPFKDNLIFLIREIFRILNYLAMES